MRSIDSAVAASKQVVVNENATRIAREKAMIVEGIKREFGITDFKNESESVKKSCRSLVLEMWNPETGLTATGRKFINEGVVNTITKDSTEEQVKSYIRKHCAAQFREYAKTNAPVSSIQGLFKRMCAEVSEKTSFDKAFCRNFMNDLLLKTVHQEVHKKSDQK